jgi:hypothetical protein
LWPCDSVAAAHFIRVTVATKRVQITRRLYGRTRVETKRRFFAVGVVMP